MLPFHPLSLVLLSLVNVLSAAGFSEAEFSSMIKLLKDRLRDTAPAGAASAGSGDTSST